MPTLVIIKRTGWLLCPPRVPPELHLLYLGEVPLIAPLPRNVMVYTRSSFPSSRVRLDSQERLELFRV